MFFLTVDCEKKATKDFFIFIKNLESFPIKITRHKQMQMQVK